MDKRRAEKSPASPAAPPAPATPGPTPSPAEGEATVAAPGAEVAVAVPAAPPAEIIPVVIELSTGFPGSAALARAMILKQFLKERPKTTDAGLAKHVVARLKPHNLPATSTPLFAPEDKIAIANSLYTDHYLFGELTKATIRFDLLSVARFGAAKTDLAAAPVYKVWFDQQVKRSVFKSAQTIKCDVARSAFTASGKSIVWAVADTGIDRNHPHFKTHDTLDLRDGLKHRDFLHVYATAKQASDAALVDEDGHGTHVAGIIAGETRPTSARKIKISTGCPDQRLVRRRWQDLRRSRRSDSGACARMPDHEPQSAVERRRRPSELSRSRRSATFSRSTSSAATSRSTGLTSA